MHFALLQAEVFGGERGEESLISRNIFLAIGLAGSGGANGSPSGTAAGKARGDRRIAGCALRVDRRLLSLASQCLRLGARPLRRSAAPTCCLGARILGAAPRGIRVGRRLLAVSEPAVPPGRCLLRRRAWHATEDLPVRRTAGPLARRPRAERESAESQNADASLRMTIIKRVCRR